MATVAEKTYYDVLGVSKEASQDDIRKAYLALAKKHHPDKTGGDKAAEEKLKEINNVYDTLKNPEKRKQYDAMLDNPFGGGPGGLHGFEDATAEGFGFDGAFADLFGDFLGRGGGRGRHAGPQPGNDIEVSLTITLREAASGAAKSVRIPRSVSCSACAGTGAAPGTSPETCPDCQGSGQVSHGNGTFFIARPCPRCHGGGHIIATPCLTCKGSGRTTEARTVSMNITPGADTGTRLRLAGQGDAGAPGAPPGDLYVFIRVAEDDLFERDGANIQCEVPITFAEAALGASVRVPTLTGRADLRVPPGTQSGRVLRLRGLGLPSLHNGRKGDLLVRVYVEVPARLSREQRELVERLAELDEHHAYPARKSFLDKLKRLTRDWAAALFLCAVGTSLLG